MNALKKAQQCSPMVVCDCRNGLFQRNYRQPGQEADSGSCSFFMLATFSHLFETPVVAL